MKNFSVIETAFFLKKISLFEKLDLDVLVAIADKMNQDIYDKNEVVFNFGNKANRMYFIAKGDVVLIDKFEKEIALLSNINFFGDESLFSKRLRQYKAICTEKTLLLSLNKTVLTSVLSECPSVSIALLNDYAKNIFCRYKEEMID